MKIAVCISGDLRNTEVAFKQVQPFWNLFRDNGVELDFYIHAWEKPNAQREVLLYNPKEYLIEPKTDDNIMAGRGQWYSAVRAFELSRKTKIAYDFKIRWRSDNLIWNYSMFPGDWTHMQSILNHDGGFVWVTNAWIDNGVPLCQDQFIISNADNMDKAFNFENLEKVPKLFVVPKEPHFPTRFFDHCTIHNLSVWGPTQQRLLRDNMVDMPWVKTNRIEIDELNEWTMLNLEFRQSPEYVDKGIKYSADAKKLEEYKKKKIE